MLPKESILILVLLLLSWVSLAQIAPKRCAWLAVTEEPFKLDSLSVLPSSISINSIPDSSLKIIYELNSGLAHFNQTTSDTVEVCFQVMPYDLSHQYFHRDIAIYDTNRFYKYPIGAVYNNSLGYAVVEEDRLFNTPGINKSGSITRGMSFGNNQNVFVNSALNLQLDGKVTENIGITASISDQNIPFQPEGNTQQLQEFDKVFIQLYTPKSSLTAGDLVMRNQPGHFLQYYRNVQGGLFEGKYEKDSTHYSFTSVGAAVSKGKFASIQLPALEGVQGPYRLTGPNNERFIIVLANSERVFIDGQLLTRGFDYDYIIDYNQAEITFTANVLVTKYSIIRVDFEYSDKNYGRSNIVANHSQTWGKTTGYFNYYLQKDNPNNPLLYNLSAEDKDALALVGDNLDQAVVSGADSVGFQENRILYEEIDSLGTKIYVFSNDPNKAIFEVAFTDVGFGNGDYEMVNSTSNGRIYVFAGFGAGNYLPIRMVTTPKKNQMFTIGSKYAFDKNIEVYGEVAVSDHDQNLYSNIDNADNAGKAVKVGFINRGLVLPGLKKWRLINSVDFEYTENTFRQIDRFRNINYERDWSADPETELYNRIVNASIGVEKDINNALVYSLSRRIKGGDEVNGFQHSLNVNKTLGKIQILSNVWWMYNDRAVTNSDWKRTSIDAKWSGKYLTPGIIYTMDKNQITDQNNEVVASAMYYDEIKFYVKSIDSAKVRYYVDYAIRENSDTASGNMVRVNQSNTINAGLNTSIGRNHDIRLQSTYRYLNYFRNIDSTNLDEGTFIVRADWNANFLNRHIRSELTITTGTGRELRREYMYQAVPQGIGTHVWEDFNGDGIQDLNEFIEKVPGLPYNQQEFIRIFVPTDEYVNAYTGSFNYRLDLDAPRSWRDQKSIVKRVVSRLSSSSAWTVNKKVFDPDIWGRFNPSEKVDNSGTLSAQKSLRANLFYNRTNPIYGMDILYATSQNKSLLTQGFETMGKEEAVYSGRVNIKRVYGIKMSLGYALKNNESDFLNQRNFLIESKNLRPELAYQASQSIRFATTGNYLLKQNLQGQINERTTFYEAGLDIRYSKVSQRSIAGNMKYIKIDAKLKDTPINSPIGYEMLDALRPGNNFTWSINWQEKLVNGLQLSFIYEGRKSEGSNIIHTGRMQASAFF
jgi:hypothetical protein